MKLRYALLIIVLSTAALVAGCKYFLTGGDNKLTLTYKTDKNAAPTTKELSAKQSIMTVTELTTTANGQAARIVRYSVYMSNYDADAKTLEREMPKVDNQIRVEIQVVGPEGSTASTVLKPGTYNASQFSDGINKFNKALDIRVNVFENGKALDQSISTVNPRKGFVKINSVDNETVSGEVDMSDDFRSVKGKFNAKIVK
jgi:hypothetical protein